MKQPPRWTDDELVAGLEKAKSLFAMNEFENHSRPIRRPLTNTEAP